MKNILFRATRFLINPLCYVFNEQQIFLMKVFQYLKRAICYIDMFYSTELLRYQSNKDYRTVTGGIISLSIILMITLGFATMIIDTLNKTSINSTLNVKKSNNPSFYNIKADAKNMFMFGVKIQSINLAMTLNLGSGPRYFDIVFKSFNVTNGQFAETKFFNLVQCTKEHWKMLPQVADNQDVFKYQNWLCPQIGQEIPIQGAYTSPTHLFGNINVAPCSNSSSDSRPCHSQQTIDKIFNYSPNFYMALYYVNPVINPIQTQYISYYLQGNDYVIFSQTHGSEAWFYFTDYKILSDQSIWPFSKNQVDLGLLVQNKAINHPFIYSEYTGYVNLLISRSQDTFIYQRSVQKISAVFSYIGGLVGAISALLFLLKTYNATAFELSVSFLLFKQKNKDANPQKKIDKNRMQKICSSNSIQNQFNLFNWIKFMAYKTLKFFNYKKKWQHLQTLLDYQSQIIQQLDISLLLRRLIALQNCMSFLFEKHQIQGIKYQKRINLQRARTLRQQLIKRDKVLNYQTEQGNENDINLQERQINQLANLGIFGNNQQVLPSPCPIFQKNSRNSQFSKFKLNKQNKIPSSSYLFDESIQSDVLINDQIIRKRSLHFLKMLKIQRDKNETNNILWNNLDKKIKTFIQEDIQNQNIIFQVKDSQTDRLNKPINQAKFVSVQQVDPI